MNPFNRPAKCCRKQLLEAFDELKGRLCKAPEVCEIEGDYICTNCRQINAVIKNFGVE